MRRSSTMVQGILCALFTVLSLSASAAEKEWTMLVFLNGNNSLDSFGPTNLKQMEKVGSTDDINVVVQWASESRETTKRMQIVKGSGDEVSSPVVQELPRVDMGDYHQLVEFVRWGVQNYPAKHYFIDVWNHGGGWHRGGMGSVMRPLDISIDEVSGHAITTPQLGLALAEAAKIIGHKVDIYASDACLMAMAEVAYEVSDSVSVFAGSEEEEPGRGWPYDTFLGRWAKNGKASAIEVGKMLTEEYTQSYLDEHRDEVTFSVLDLTKMEPLIASLRTMAGAIAKLDDSDTRTFNEAVRRAQRFDGPYQNDYVDLGDVASQARTARSEFLASDIWQSTRVALKDLVVETKSTPQYAKATGLSVWIPLSQSIYQRFADNYQQLKFEKATGWSSAVRNLFSKSR